jgi:hypothetical protein
MTLVGHAQWFISKEACALCDDERHLAHIVRAGERWFAFDATRPNGEGCGCLFLGSFVRLLTAMAAAESDTLKTEGVTARAEDPGRVQELTLALLRDAQQLAVAPRRRAYARHTAAALRSR